MQAHLTAYGFHVVNPNSVVEGRKPILEEVGPFVYKAVTIKDSVNLTDGNVNLKYNDDGETLTYRPRLVSNYWLFHLTLIRKYLISAFCSSKCKYM